MKNLFLVLCVLAAPCVAHSKVTPPQVVIDPAAKTLLDKATATYHAAKGIRFKLLVKENNTQTNYSLAFQKPNRLRLAKNASGEVSQLVADGKSSYRVTGTTYTRAELPDKAATLWQTLLNNGTGFLVPGMLEGRSPVVVLQDLIKGAPDPQPRMTVKVPPPAFVDGVQLQGVKINLSTGGGGQGVPVSLTEIYVWFGADGLLRRISTRNVSDKNDSPSVEQISDQQLNPTFSAGEFKFDTTGLSLASEPEPTEFDTRLKVGALPLSFSAKDLKGQTISPAKYKGKVLLLDFWATWCGPCVAALPELKSVYSKYHPKGLEVVGISLDEDKKALTSFIKTRKMPWSQVFDGKGWEARVPGIYGVRAIPFLLIIGKDGKIAAVNPRDDLEGAVKKALAAK